MRIGTVLLILVLLYGAGVIARSRFGIAVVVRNQSQSVLRNSSIKVSPPGLRLPIPDLEPGQSTRVYVLPVGESAIELEYLGGENERRSEMLASYVESGYCGSTTAELQPGGSWRVHDDTSRLVYWKSWLEFL